MLAPLIRRTVIGRSFLRRSLVRWSFVHGRLGLVAGWRVARRRGPVRSSSAGWQLGYINGAQFDLRRISGAGLLVGLDTVDGSLREAARLLHAVRQLNGTVA